MIMIFMVLLACSSTVFTMEPTKPVPSTRTVTRFSVKNKRMADFEEDRKVKFGRTEEPTKAELLQQAIQKLDIVIEKLDKSLDEMRNRRNYELTATHNAEVIYETVKNVPPFIKYVATTLNNLTRWAVAGDLFPGFAANITVPRSFCDESSTQKKD